MYVFMIWDYKNKNAIVVRDKIGIKPLYYALIPNFLRVHLECNALVKSNLVTKKDIIVWSRFLFSIWVGSATVNNL